MKNIHKWNLLVKKALRHVQWGKGTSRLVSLPSSAVFDHGGAHAYGANPWQTALGDQGYDRLALEGYQQNVIAYRCINVISRALSSVQLLLYKQDFDHATLAGEHEVDVHPVLDLLAMPSPLQAGSAFMEKIVSHLLLSGNAYVESWVDGDGVPLRLQVIRPDKITVFPDGYGIVKDGMNYQSPHAPSYALRFVARDPISLKSDVLHIKLFHPLNDDYGFSPMAAAAKAIDQHNAVAFHNLALLRNGGRPSGALLLKDTPHGLGLSDMQRQHLKDELKNIVEGRANAGRVMVLEGDFTWQEMGLTPKDLDFVEGKNMSAREICQAFGVPPMLAGVPGDATFANYKEARFHLWEDTVLPLLDMIIAELNRWLLPYYGDDYRLGYDLDQIQALAPKRELAWAKIGASDFLTINEKRQAVGYGPIVGGDVLPGVKKNDEGVGHSHS